MREKLNQTVHVEVEVFAGEEVGGASNIKLKNVRKDKKKRTKTRGW